MGFRGFTQNSPLRNHAKYQKPCLAPRLQYLASAIHLGSHGPGQKPKSIEREGLGESRTRTWQSEALVFPVYRLSGKGGVFSQANSLIWAIRECAAG